MLYITVSRAREIGSVILRFLINEYVNNRNKAWGLLVDKDNPQAKNCTSDWDLTLWEKKYCQAKTWNIFNAETSILPDKFSFF